MSNFLVVVFFLSLLGIAIGLIKPSLVLPAAFNPTRGKVLLFYMMLIIAVIIFWGVFLKTATSLEEALANKDKTFELDLGNQNLNSLDERIKQLPILEELKLDSNNFTSVPEIIFDMPKLRKVNLASNPIKELPAQLQTSDLYAMDLSYTQVRSIPSGFITRVNLILNGTLIDSLDASVAEAIRKGDLRISLKDTPYQRKKDEQLAITKQKLKRNSEDESFWQIAAQRILGKEYGTPLKHNKLTIYYKNPVTRAEADTVALLLTALGYGNDKYVDVQLLRDPSRVPALYKLRFVTEPKAKLDDDAINAFKLIGVLVSSVLGETEVDIHICDTQFRDLRIISWTEVKGE